MDLTSNYRNRVHTQLIAPVTLRDSHPKRIPALRNVFYTLCVGDKYLWTMKGSREHLLEQARP